LGKITKKNIDIKIGDIEMKKRWKGIVAATCMTTLFMLWYQALTTLDEITALCQ
jgi:hypothetical protein